MPILLQQIDTLTTCVIGGEQRLDEALAALERWMQANAPRLDEDERRSFSAALDTETTNDDRSLIDSVLKLHTTRLLYRYDNRQQPPLFPESGTPTAYERARNEFGAALRRSEEGINEARIDIAIANAHQLLHDSDANRRWLDAALERLPALAAVDLVALARAIPAMPPPRLNLFQRMTVKLLGLNFERLSAANQETFVKLARMQINQVILLAHLIGVSFETSRERQRANRAFRIAAHLIVRHEGMAGQEPDQLLDLAESLIHTEPEAAQILARQAADLCDDGDSDCRARAEALLQ